MATMKDGTRGPKGETGVTEGSAYAQTGGEVGTGGSMVGGANDKSDGDYAQEAGVKTKQDEALLEWGPGSDPAASYRGTEPSGDEEE